MNKFIFLDIDGVLNSITYYSSISFNREGYPYSEFDPSKIELLNTLIDKTEAKIVISSTWRIGNSLDEIEEFMRVQGFKHTIFSMTPKLEYKGFIGTVPRECEIHEWLNTNAGHDYDQMCRYVIVDDNSDMLCWQRENFFHVDAYYGLTPNTIYKIERYFNKI